MLKRVSGVLLDLSGTLFVDKAPTPGAIAALERYAAIWRVASVQNIESENLGQPL